MRAYAWVRHLSTDADVHLVIADGPAPQPQTTPAVQIHVVPRHYPTWFAKLRSMFVAACRADAMPPIPHAVCADGPTLRSLVAQCSGIRPECIVVFRLGMYPLGRVLAERLGVPVLDLDLDDLESVNHAGLARLHWQHRHFMKAAKEWMRAYLLRWSENRVLKQVRTVYVCSAADQTRLQAAHPHAHVDVFKNSVSILPAPRRPLPVPHLLFVGTLDYFPNEDAAIWIAEAIVPALRKAVHTPFVVQIVGRNAPERLIRRLSACPEVCFLGALPDLRPVYETACCALVPLRAGSGTKLKILEAFAHGVPVVATHIAVHGMELTHEKELLLADAPEGIADAVTDLLGQPERAARLTRSAQAYLHRQGVLHPLPA